MINSSGFFGSPTALPDTQTSGLELLYESPEGNCLLLKGHRNDRVVVYKCLKAQFKDDPVQQRMLRREYEIGASLKHPGVCEVLGWVVIPGYGDSIEMEYVDGQRLDAWLLAEHRSLQEQRKLLFELCDALSYIHRKQVVHKDLKPENILVTRNGSHTKIIDFGLSDSDSVLTGKDPAGTIQYAAPEVIAGDAAGERSDIFSFGRILQNMSPAFSRIARKCTETNPEKRYASFDEIQKDLAAVSGQHRLWGVFLIVILLFAVLLLLYRPKRSDPVEDLFLDAVEQVKEAATPA